MTSVGFLIKDATLTSSNDWSYISEGANNLVLAFRGEQNASFLGMVLRLRKASRTMHQQSAFAAVSAVSLVQQESYSLGFQQLVGRLLPPDCLPHVEEVRVQRAWLERLADDVEHLRPEHRRRLDGIDVYREKAVIAADLVSGDVIALEIKPKWGFLPSTSHLSPYTALIKTSHCRFCMHKYLKSLNDSESLSTPMSSYCPLDFYSGDKDRMKHALHALWNSWVSSKGQANNFRLFVRGRVLNPDEPGYLLELGTALSGQDTLFNDVKSAVIDKVLASLLGSPLLGNIRFHQKAFDPLDVEGLSALYNSIHPGLPLGSLELDPTLEEWSSFFDDFLIGRIPSEPHLELRYYILAYLLSATFKDCSIMLRIPCDGSDTAKIWAIDMDPKPVQRLAKWERLDKQIVDAFATSGIKRPCLDTEKTGVS